MVTARKIIFWLVTKGYQMIQKDYISTKKDCYQQWYPIYCSRTGQLQQTFGYTMIVKHDNVWMKRCYTEQRYLQLEDNPKLFIEALVSVSKY